MRYTPNNHQQNLGRGLVYWLAAILFFSGLDATAKYLTQTYPVMQVVWARYAVHFVLGVLLLSGGGWKSVFRPNRPWLQAGRSAALLVATICFFSALRFIPLAEATAIIFVAPFMIVGISVFFLGEHVGIRRIAAVGVGLVGVLVILRPGAGAVHWAAFLPLVTAAGYAIYQVLTRMVAAADPPLVSLFYAALFGTVVMSFIVPFHWVTPSAFDLAAMVALGLFAAIGHWLVILALQYATAAELAPFHYVQMPLATATGLILFGDFPDRWTILGAGMIVASGLFVLYREARARRSAARSS